MGKVLLGVAALLFVSPVVINSIDNSTDEVSECVHEMVVKLKPTTPKSLRDIESSCRGKFDT